MDLWKGECIELASHFNLSYRISREIRVSEYGAI